MKAHLKGEPPALWDPVVRVTHWALALAVIGNALITQGGSVVHVWIGWIGMVVLLARLGWGFVGPVEARFTAFPPSPRGAMAHLRDLARGRPASYVSHNPAGTAMVYALWGSLAIVILTGLTLTGFATPLTVAAQKAAANTGDWSVLASDGGAAAGLSRTAKHLLEDIHVLTANLMLILAFVHVGGVFLESRMTRRNLVRPMLLRARPVPHRGKVT